MEEKVEDKTKDKKRERKKVLLIMGIIIFLALTVTAMHLDICACWEGGKFSEKIVLQIGEEQRMNGTNYSLLLKNAQSGTCDSVYVEIYNDSGYVNETLLSTGGTTVDARRYEIGNCKIVLKEVTNERTAEFSIYFI